METFITELSEQGVLGLMLAITMTALFVVVKLLLNEKDKRIEDARTVQESIAAPLTHIKDSIDLLQQKVVISKRAERNDS